MAITSPEQLLRDNEVVLDCLPALITGARISAQRQALQYRDFLVGASGVFRGEDGRHALFTGWTYKPTKDTPKTCAEMMLLEQAKGFDQRLVRALGIAVSATTLQDEIEGVVGSALPTLPPCQPCVEGLNKNPLVDPNTLVISVGTSIDIATVNSVGQLTDAYPEGQVVVPELLSDAVQFDLRMRTCSWLKAYDAHETAVAGGMLPAEAISLALSATTRLC